MNRVPVAVALLLPILLVNLVTFVWPVLNLAALSFRQSLSGGGLGGAGLGTWKALVTDPFYAELAASSIGVALLVTVLALLCAYPVALFVHRAPARWRNLLVVLCISPLLVSAVVRTYGWLVILGDSGLLPSMLRGLGMVKPPRLVFNLTGVVTGLVEIIMPYMILALLAGFGRLSPTLEEAAASLGAPPWKVFLRIVLPLSLPGVVLGCLLAFVLTLSSFITPKLLGGGRVILLATEIYDQAIVTLNWPLAAALSVVVLVVFGAISEVRDYAMPIWARGLSPVTTKRLFEQGEFCVDVSCGGVPVRPGDAILADENGVLVLPSGDIAAAARRAIEMQAAEGPRLAQVAKGARLSDLNGTTAKLLELVAKQASV